jgi:hypothetical protein
MAPICQGKSNCPTQFGRKPGIIAAPATGFVFAAPLPVGNPKDGSYVVPLVDQVQTALSYVTSRSTPTLHSLAGDLALTDAKLRETRHVRHLLTVGIPRTVEPLSPTPTPAEIHAVLTTAGLPRKRPPTRYRWPAPPATAAPWSRVASPVC